METSTQENVEHIELSSSEEPGAQPGGDPDIMQQFDEVLGKQLDRLLGTRLGLEMLPMNIFSMSCLIMLATRETEIQSFPYLPPERYTRETIMDSLEEMNIGAGDELDSCIREMIQRGYMNVSEDGRVFSDSPAIKMAQVFDRIFPRMPGLNLVAYLGQMIDEVSTKRKELKTALSQFEQMLSLHGVPLKREQDSHQPDTGRQFPHLKVGEESQPVVKKIISTSVKPSNIFSQLETKTWKAPVHKPEMPTITQDQMHQDVDAHKFLKQQEADARDLSNRFSETEDKAREIFDTRAPETMAEAGVAGVPQQDPLENSQGSVAQPDQSLHAPEGPSEKKYQWNWDQIEDDDIDKKIAEFQEQLGMTCPLCRTSGILPRVTAKGKQYYKCSRDDCNFISWGKPYYITCPKCENPFLVESPDSQGNMMLKCPRATCPHWQKFPWEEDDEPDIKSIEPQQTADISKKPRKVVKRRRRVVVRRKA
jgi:ssDNA-binding Zn-finger/Zn-ribbon topoisomerase 1